MSRKLLYLALLVLIGGNLGANCGGGSLVPAITIDNTDDELVTVVGTWDSGSCDDGNGCYGEDFLYHLASPGEDSYVRFTPQIQVAGNYTVYLWWSAEANRTTAQPVTVHHAGGDAVSSVNLQEHGHQWFLLGTYSFNAGTGSYIDFSSDTAEGYCNADAVRLVYTP